MALRPIILGNAPSAGSSLLRVMLQRHPAITGAGELSILDKRGLYDVSPQEYRRNIKYWLDKGYPTSYLGSGQKLFTNLEEYSITRDEVVKLALDSSSYADLLQRFGGVMSKAGRWLEKTPANVFAFDRINEVFPDASFVHIIRDGRDCVASLVRRGLTPFRAVSRWYYSTLAGIQYRNLSNYYELRYEELVADPKGSIIPLVKWLGETALSDSFWEPTSHDSNGNLSRLDGWRSDAAGEVSTSSVGQHETEMTSDVVSMMCTVCLSAEGRALLHANSNVSVAESPAQLQESLGYSVEGLSTTVRLKGTVRSNVRTELKVWQDKSKRLYGVNVPCETALPRRRLALM